MSTTEVQVEYFASLREQAGKEHEKVSGPFLSNGDLYLQLQKKYGFDLPLSMIQVAVNDEFSLMESPVVDGTRIVFIPPIAGG